MSWFTSEIFLMLLLNLWADINRASLTSSPEKWRQHRNTKLIAIWCWLQRKSKTPHNVALCWFPPSWSSVWILLKIKVGLRYSQSREISNSQVVAFQWASLPKLLSYSNPNYIVLGTETYNVSRKNRQKQNTMGHKPVSPASATATLSIMGRHSKHLMKLDVSLACIC